VSPISAGWQELAAGTSSVHVAVDRIDAVGPDTVKFLHSLVSQNIADLAIGSGAWTFLLQPQGKVTSFAFALRLAEEHVVLLAEAGFGEALHIALSRYRIRTKCELALNLGSSALVSFADGVPTFSVTETPEPFAGGEGPAIYNTARIVNGWPIQPNEISESTIPNETGVLRQSVNFTKGCYVGQELVERIDSRAATTPRRLVRLVDFSMVSAVVNGAVGGVVSAVVSDDDAGQMGDGAELTLLALDSMVGADLFMIAHAPSDAPAPSDPALGAGDDAAVSLNENEPAVAKTKAVGVLTSFASTVSGVGGICALAYVARAVENGARVTIGSTALVATVAVLRNDVPVATVAPLGVRSSATMGKKG
jgi:tRNA-modifying protein YgfZ